MIYGELYHKGLDEFLTTPSEDCEDEDEDNHYERWGE